LGAFEFALIGDREALQPSRVNGARIFLLHAWIIRLRRLGPGASLAMVEV
jgi:hypothetical protein